MKKVSVVLFQLGVLFITLIVLLIAGFILPRVARDFALDTPDVNVNEFFYHMIMN